MRSYSRARAVYPVLLTRISYQVGSPWMLDGNRFFPETGMPIRKIACIKRLLALADPVPLTLASLIAQSFTRTAPVGARLGESAVSVMSCFRVFGLATAVSRPESWW